MGLSVGVAVGVDADDSGVLVTVDVDIGERGVSRAGTGVWVGVKVVVGGIGVAVDSAEVGSGVAVGRIDTAVGSVVSQAVSSNAQSKRLNRCRFMALLSPSADCQWSAQRMLSSPVRSLGPSFPVAVERPKLLSRNNPLGTAGVQGIECFGRLGFARRVISPSLLLWCGCFRLCRR